jgi:Mg2+ and Co2+ transporter CorA
MLETLQKMIQDDIQDQCNDMIFHIKSLTQEVKEMQELLSNSNILPDKKEAEMLRFANLIA